MPRRNNLALIALLCLGTAGALRAQARPPAAQPPAPAVTTTPAAPAPAVTTTPSAPQPAASSTPATTSPAEAPNPADVVPGGVGIPVKSPKLAEKGEEPTLVFDREVYSYPSGPRRDPFMALVGKHDAGPLFDDLNLRGIIYSPGGNSLVVLSDGKKTYRAHRGEMIGNARVVEITPTRVIFSVDNFGVWRQQSLELKKNLEGDRG